MVILQRHHSQIVLHCLTYYQLSKEAGYEPKRIRQLRNDTVRAIRAIPTISDELGEQDIFNVLNLKSLSSLYLNKPFRELSKEDIAAFIRKELLIPKSYEFFFLLKYLYNFPDNYKLGFGSLRHFATLPSAIHSYFIEKWARNFKARHPQSDVSAYLKREQDAILFTVSLLAHGHEKAIQKAKELASESMHILRIFYGRDFQPDEYAFLVNGNISSGGIEESLGVVSIYQDNLDALSNQLSAIFVANTPDDLNKRLRNAARLSGLAIEANRPEVSFTLLTTALEALLMTEGDRDYLRLKIAEKTAFLLENDPHERAMLFEVVKDAYDRRSDFVHQNQNYTPVMWTEVIQLWDLFSRVLRRLLGLSKNGYTQIQKKKGKKTIDALVDELKFN